MKAIDGENIAVVGATNTGKTYTCLQYAHAIQARTGKTIIIVDQNNVRYYSQFQDISLEDLVMGNFERRNAIYKIPNFDDSEFDELFDYITKYVTNIILILDDIQNVLTGNLNKDQMKFLTSPKNNGNDIFFQFHNLTDLAPKVCRNLHVMIIKQQTTDNIPSKVPMAEIIDKLHQDVIEENKPRPFAEKWSYRILDMRQEMVFFENKKAQLVSMSLRDYLDLRKKFKK